MMSFTETDVNIEMVANVGQAGRDVFSQGAVWYNGVYFGGHSRRNIGHVTSILPEARIAPRRDMRRYELP